MFLKVSFKKTKILQPNLMTLYFRIYTRALVQAKELLLRNPNVPTDQIYNPVFRRGIFTVGLLMRFFDFSRPAVNGSNTNEKSKFD